MAIFRCDLAVTAFLIQQARTHFTAALKVINTQRVCMHSKARQSYSNLQTDASRRLTESTSGLSGTFFRKTKKGVFSITALLERYEHYKLTGTKPPA